jgi:type I restriction enzyme S subunit
VRPDPARCITDFLYYQMRFKAQTGGLREFTTQATIAHLSGEKLSKLPIILPPLAEQQRIVEILDRAAAIQRLRRAAEEKAREIIPALFVDMFGDPATNPKGWPVATLAQLARFISGGTPAKLNSAYWSGDVPWVSPKDMKVWSIDDAQDHISERVFLETNIKKIDAGAVLIVVRGMILAHTVPVAINERRIAVNQDMKAIVPSSKVLPYFLLWALRTRHHELLSVVGTAAHGTKKIDTEHLERFAILVPPIELQRRFAQIVENEKGRIALSKAATVTAGQMQISLSKKLLG